MKQQSQNLSSLIDNEFDGKDCINEIIDNPSLQNKFSRYQYIGDVMRGESNDVGLHIDVTDSVMAAIANENQDDNVVTLETTDSSDNNVLPFVKRFGQYAIAASVAGVVVVSSLMVNEKPTKDSSVVPVLNTMPFAGGATPVSLKAATSPEVKREIEERNKRLEILLKDHQLQLQAQP